MSNSDITTTLYLATGLPGTFDKAGYEALTWVLVNGIVSVGEVGVTDNMVDVPDLATGFTKGIKGARAGRDIAIALREIKADTGQGNLKTASLAFVADYSIKILEAEGTEVEYASGIPHDWVRNERADGSYAGFTCQFRLNYAPVLTTIPV